MGLSLSGFLGEGCEHLLFILKTRAGGFWRSLDPLAIEHWAERNHPGITALPRRSPIWGLLGSLRNRMIKGTNPPATPQGPFPDPRALNSFYNIPLGQTGVLSG